MVLRFLKKSYNKLHIHPTFFLLFFWFLINKQLYSFLLFLVVVLSHEFGHYIVAKKLKYRLDNFYIAPYGVCLNYKEKAFDSRDEIKIAIAGPLVNIFLSIIVVAIWWIYPSIYNFSQEFITQSLVLGLFNLLPCYPLDGGRVFVGIMSESIERKKAVKIVSILNYIFSALLFILFVISCFINFNPTLLLCSVFLLFGVIDSKFESKYQSIDFAKKVKNFSKTSMLYVDENTCLSQLVKHVEINKFTIFVVNLSNGKTKMIDEQNLKLLILKYPSNIKLKDIF